MSERSYIFRIDGSSTEMFQINPYEHIQFSEGMSKESIVKCVYVPFEEDKSVFDEMVEEIAEMNENKERAHVLINFPEDGTEAVVPIEAVKWMDSGEDDEYNTIVFWLAFELIHGEYDEDGQ